MSRTYTLRKLLEHGGLSRKEIIEITGWQGKQVHYTLAYLAQINEIKKDGKNWVLG